MAVYLHPSAPDKLTFVENDFGKPRLQLSQNEEPRLFFNMTHSADLALYGVTRVGELGVDVEQVRTVTDMEGLVARYFTPIEREAIAGADEVERDRVFFECWTRKEALIKAWGCGVSVPLEEVDASPGLSDVPRFSGPMPTAGVDTKGWVIHGINPADGYVGATATSVLVDELHCWRW